MGAFENDWQMPRYLIGSTLPLEPQKNFLEKKKIEECFLVLHTIMSFFHHLFFYQFDR